MLKLKKQAPGILTRSRTALMIVAATVLAGGSATEASARSYRHHSHLHHIHHHHHLARASSGSSAWRNSNALVTASGGGQTFAGMASYYGTESGSQTASGARFIPSAMTAAHRTLPFGTKVLVTNKSNGRSVVVTINDRGPFVGGRIIDLSTGAAGAIGMLGAGVAPVSLEVLGKG